MVFHAEVDGVWAAVIAYFLRYGAVLFERKKLGPTLRETKMVNFYYLHMIGEGGEQC